MLEEWLPALRGGEAPRVPSFRDGWQVQRVIDAARASSEHAGWVEL
jgi:predicted dehydrogenase